MFHPLFRHALLCSYVKLYTIIEELWTIIHALWTNTGMHQYSTIMYHYITEIPLNTGIALVLELMISLNSCFMYPNSDDI